MDEELNGNYNDYYESFSYSDGYGIGNFGDSDYYQEPSSDGFWDVGGWDDSDWDDSDWDWGDSDWDSGSTDWDSDW